MNLPANISGEAVKTSEEPPRVLVSEGSVREQEGAGDAPENVLMPAESVPKDTPAVSDSGTPTDQGSDQVLTETAVTCVSVAPSVMAGLHGGLFRGPGELLRGPLGLFWCLVCLRDFADGREGPGAGC